MLSKTIERVSHVAALAGVLVFGVPLAGAGETSVWQAFDRPAVSLLSGVQGCATALRDGASEGSRCLAGWSVNDLVLDAMTRLATENGRAMFGKHFRVVNSLSYSPAANGLSGGLDVVFPFSSSTPPGTLSPESSAFFLQQGITPLDRRPWVEPKRFSYRRGSSIRAVRRRRAVRHSRGIGLCPAESRVPTHATGCRDGLWRQVGTGVAQRVYTHDGLAVRANGVRSAGTCRSGTWCETGPHHHVVA